jgi:hypothetical protein
MCGCVRSWRLKKFGIASRPGKFQAGNQSGGNVGKNGVDANGWKGGKQVVPCTQCGKRLERFPSLIRENNFCNFVCRGEWQQPDLSGKRFGLLTAVQQAKRDSHNHIQWQCLCECGGEKTVRTGDLISGLVKSCGCMAHPKGEANHKWTGGKNIEVMCANPGCNNTKMVYPCHKKAYGHFFCSDKCKGEYRSKVIRGENHPKWKPRIEVSCAFCGENLTITATRKRLYGKSFCNVDCQGKWISENKAGSNNANWRGGKSFEPYPTTWNFRLREAIRDRDGRECQVCGKAENGERLAVHHIDYEKTNIAPENLVALCHTCHCKTVTNRDQWQAFFISQRDGLRTGMQQIAV